MSDSEKEEEEGKKAKRKKRLIGKRRQRRWNHRVKLLEIHTLRDDPSSSLRLDCCITCNNKNTIRAAVTGNAELLNAAINRTDSLSDLTEPWSSDARWTALEYLVFNNRVDMLEAILRPMKPGMNGY